MTYIIGRISGVFGAVAALASFGLILVTLFEVISRYVFHAPTIWAFDVSYMLNGAIFVLAMALTLRMNQHVAVDIVSKAMPEKVFRAIEIAVYLLLILPAISLVAYAGWSEFWKSWLSGEVETVSPWRPYIWPFRLMLAIGLSALWLQVLARVFAPADRTSPM
ncbi:TRAP transporter small permease subunit [Oceanibaculum pacificum]|uniref:TRAP transporter small permease protein n=1 Tax=Oceanibaculum pacificum TaxID=580166 RepID=A0A154VVW0_9PROT|nr:TRAP transporter small permease subunit [Oceanibaculum pacificum]KZD05341.1 hypothetical protein AUP43_11775 [Oceanibaculum pacificum]